MSRKTNKCVCVCVQASCSRMDCVFRCGSVTVWTPWGRFGLQVATTRQPATTARVPTGSFCAPIRAARLPASGAHGPIGRPAVFPVGGAREPDTGEEVEFNEVAFYLFFFLKTQALSNT